MISLVDTAHALPDLCDVSMCIQANCMTRSIDGKGLMHRMYSSMLQKWCSCLGACGRNRQALHALGRSGTNPRLLHALYEQSYSLREHNIQLLLGQHLQDSCVCIIPSYMQKDSCTSQCAMLAGASCMQQPGMQANNPTFIWIYYCL